MKKERRECHQQDESRERSGNWRAMRRSEQGLALERERPGYRPGQWKEGEQETRAG